MTGPEPRFSTTLRELIARTYKRDDHGRFSSGFGSKGSPRDLADSDDVIRRELEFHDSASGMTMRVHSIDRTHGEPSISLHVTDREGRDVGEYHYTLHIRGESGDARFGLARLVPEAQGQGFGTKAAHHVEETLRAYGNTKVTGYAALGNGGFAWARQGWDFEDPGARMDVQDRALYIAKSMFTPAQKTEVRRVAKMKDSTPADFAEIGFEPGMTTWPGKEIMRGAVYGMVKRLDT